MAKRHAYLITAYNNFYILEKLIKLLDDERNDIYIHLDKKVKDFDFDRFNLIATKSKLVFVPRVEVFWASFSQVVSILNLFKAAVSGQYHYYHLISGVDLPIKSQDFIHAFFLDKDKEFIAISPIVTKYHNRAKYYQFFLDNAYYRTHKALKCAREVLSIVQKSVGINRFRNSGLQVYDGWDWYSITHDLLKHILSMEQTIVKYFHTSLCPSELFMSTIVMNSPDFKEKVYCFSDFGAASLRHIDWARGRPYTFRAGDLTELIGSQAFFARKFDQNTDRTIVDAIFSHISGQQNR